jgi:hypothetical protein
MTMGQFKPEATYDSIKMAQARCICAIGRVDYFSSGGAKKKTRGKKGITRIQRWRKCHFLNKYMKEPRELMIGMI